MQKWSRREFNFTDSRPTRRESFPAYCRRTTISGHPGPYGYVQAIRARIVAVVSRSARLMVSQIVMNSIIDG